MYLYLLILFTNKIIFNYPYIWGTINKTDSITLNGDGFYCEGDEKYDLTEWEYCIYDIQPKFYH